MATPSVIFADACAATSAGLLIWPPPPYTLLSHDFLTVTTVAAALPTAPSAAQLAYLISDVANLRWRADGTLPTGDIGVFFQAGGWLPIGSSFFTTFKVILLTGSVPGSLAISWFG